MTSLDYSRFGTRISLSDRFAMIRKEAQKRSILVNPTLDQTQAASQDGRPMKNFNDTVSRADRPSAALQQGSERNKRLIYQMAIAPTLLAEITGSHNSVYSPQIRAQIPTVPAARPLFNQTMRFPIGQQQPLQQASSTMPVRRGMIRQRLGALRNVNGNGIKSRLGIKRKPIAQRLGAKPASPGLPLKNNLRPKNTINFKRKNIAAKFNQPTKQIRNFRSGKPGLNRTPLAGRKPAAAAATPTVRRVTAEQLDQDLDVYMKNTKGYLNADLDAYMSQIDS